ncbi:MAG: LD-carboxypeptidase [Candidatus Woesearchaeota archaeon]
MIIKPRHLEKGDKIGIISPSSSIKDFPKRTKRGILQLERMGFQVVISPNTFAKQGPIAGSSEQRAEDLNAFFEDEDIKAIICSTGGYNSNAILPLIDYNLIKKNPKIICGYSDITAVLCAVHKKTGLITFHGPTLLPSFGEFGGLLDFTKQNFEKVLMTPRAIGMLQRPREYTSEFLIWECEDNRKRKMRQTKPWMALNTGVAEGAIIGGNTETLLTLVGTEFFPELRNKLLFLEDETLDIGRIVRDITHLEQIGVFDTVCGVVYARSALTDANKLSKLFYETLREIGENHQIPVLVNVDFGHTDPRLILPIGIKAKLDANQRTISIPYAATI